LVALTEALSAAYDCGKQQGFPAFPLGIQSSNPLNSTPYLGGICDMDACGCDPSRRQLVLHIHSLLRVLRRISVEPVALLVGGSFLRVTEQPKDLDCVLFYKADGDVARDLFRYQKGIAKVGVDLRFVPIDSDPLIALKSAIYFGTLYSMRKGDDPGRPGAVLFDCRNTGAEL
jgi:hypothetical protein